MTAAETRPHLKMLRILIKAPARFGNGCLKPHPDNSNKNALQAACCATTATRGEKQYARRN
jgi:hypothetical protein